jgi:hypothetical protein
MDFEPNLAPCANFISQIPQYSSAMQIRSKNTKQAVIGDGSPSPLLRDPVNTFAISHCRGLAQGSSISAYILPDKSRIQRTHQILTQVFFCWHYQPNVSFLFTQMGTSEDERSGDNPATSLKVPSVIYLVSTLQRK